MTEARQRIPLATFAPDFDRKIDDYKPYIGLRGVDALKRLAEPVQGKGWANLNSTFIGGGVAEILRSVIPLARNLGIQADWYTIRGNHAFFQVTKKFHNMLQGMPFPVSLEEIFNAYLDTIDQNAQHAFIASHMVVVHDPQPAALVMNGVMYGNVLWRCHIDTSSPNLVIWRFLLPYINICAGAIFTMPQFVGPGIQVPTYQIMPCIDPLAPKNHRYSQEEALNHLSPLFNAFNIDPGRPIIAAISRYDIHKNQSTVIKAFHLMRREHTFKKPPYLIFLGNTATDDPEGEVMLADLKKKAGEDPDIIFWVNVENNDRVVGSLMKLCNVFVHVSTKEGFGLVVSEAAWQGTPVIGSNVGGIPEQIKPGESGYVVDPGDVATLAARMAALLEDPEGAARLGEKGHDLVRNHFLLPELVKRYVTLLRFIQGTDDQVPSFRMNDMTYSELMLQVKQKHPYFQRLSN